MEIYCSNGYLGIINDFDNIYKNNRNAGGFYFKQKRIQNWATFLLLILLIIYIFFILKGHSQFGYAYIFIAFSTISIIPFLIYGQKEKNKKYRFYNIVLEEPLFFNFQNKAQATFNQMMANVFEEELIIREYLVNSNQDIDLLYIYINEIKDVIQKTRRESLFKTKKIAIIGIVLTLGASLIGLICHYYNLNIFSLDFLIIVLLTLLLLFMPLHALAQIEGLYTEIQNQRVYRLEQILNFLKSILIKRSIEYAKQSNESKRENLFDKKINHMKSIFICIISFIHSSIKS